jgi:hypothetical protein
MTLRDDIKHILFNAGLPTSRGEAADAILAAIREHMTSDEAVERAHNSYCGGAFRSLGVDDEDMKDAILAALGGGNETE